MADRENVPPEDDPIERELILNRFRLLVSEMRRGGSARNSFQPWEIEILMDFESARVEPRLRLEMLRLYEKAVEKQLETRPGPPMKFSEYLHERRTRRPSTR